MFLDLPRSKRTHFAVAEDHRQGIRSCCQLAAGVLPANSEQP